MKYFGYGKQIQGETFYTPRELSEILRIQPSEIDGYMAAGELQTKTINQARMISDTTLETFLKTHYFPAMHIGGEGY